MKKLIFCLALLLFGCTGKLTDAGPAKPNILVILIDTLRADHLGFNGYERDTSPNLDAFARENLNFKYAYSSSAWTPPAVASLFSGVYASVHGHMPLKSDDAERAKGKFSKLDESFSTLAELLRDAGYDTGCISANPMVSEKYGLEQGFNHFYSPGRESAQLVNQRSLKFLKDLRAKEKPFFLYMHYMDPHFPYTPIPPYDTMFNGSLKSREYRPREEKFIGRYDGEIRYVDDKIGEMFAWLKENKLYDDLVILIVSDHGEQFMERGHLGHADRLHTEEVHVPLMLKAAGKKGESTVPVSLVDVLPTLLDVAKVPVDSASIHGRSLISELAERKEEGVLIEVVRHYNQKAFITADGKKALLEYEMEKGLVNPDPTTTIKEHLYDIYKDNFEIAPLKDAKLLSEMKEGLKRYYIEILKLRERYKNSEIDMDAETFERLKTLGYI